MANRRKYVKCVLKCDGYEKPFDITLKDLNNWGVLSFKDNDTGEEKARICCGDQRIITALSIGNAIIGENAYVV